MQAPSDFQPQLVNTSNMPYAAPPQWLRSQRFPGEETFAQADRHALEVAQIQHESFKDLLFHLVYTESWSDIEAARVLFRWMTAKPMYSIEFSGAPPGTPEELIMGFRDGKSTYCRIYELLCLYAGIPCITVVGYAKGIEFRPGMQFNNGANNHSWNVIYVDNSWQLVDSHWATRYLQSNDNNVPQDMVYEYDDFYFCPDPEALVYSHFPEDPKWQLLRQPLSVYDFEDLPIAKSAFFKNTVRFLSHHRGVVPTQNGCVNMSLGNYHPLSFTFKLAYGESCRDELAGVKLTRYGIQETRDGQLNLFIRAPVKGFYYLTVYCTSVKHSANEESVFSAVCEYKIICDAPYPNVEPYPFVSDTNWGPGAEAYQAGLIPNCRDAVIVAHDGHIELDFEKTRPIRVLPKLQSSRASEQQCEQAIKQDDNDYITRLDIDLPVNGEYALEIYANDPARDGNTYTHVCQYLLVRPEPGDNRDALFYQTPQYTDCYNVHGQQEPLQNVSMSLQDLAGAMQNAHIGDQMVSEPRPAAKQAAMRGVEVEQITVPKSKPSTAPKPRGEKPVPPGKPSKPTPKPKPKASSQSSAGLPAHGSDDYANLPLSKHGQQPSLTDDQYGNVGPDGQPIYGNVRYGQDKQPGYGTGREVEPLYAVGVDGKPLYGPDGKPIYATGPYGTPIYAVNPEGKPVYGNRPDGKAAYAAGTDGQMLYDMDGEPLFAVGPDGKPLYTQDSKPLYATGRDGQPLNAYTTDGHPIYAVGADGAPNFGVGADGNPLYAYGTDGQLLYGPDGRPLYGPDGNPLYASAHDGRPIYPLSEDGQPMYGVASDGKPLYGVVATDKKPLYAVGTDGNHLYGPDGKPLYGTDGQPLYSTDQDGRPMYTVGPEGLPLYAVDQEGRPIYGQDGKPLYALGSDGRPLYAVGPDGRPIYGVGVDGVPIYGSDPNSYGKSSEAPGKYTDLGYKPFKSRRGPGESYDGQDPYSQEDLERYKGKAPVDDPMTSGDWQQRYGSGAPGGRNYSQSSLPGGDEDFPAPPPASDMLNMEFAPERNKSEIPIAPKSFEPIHIAEVDTSMSNVPKPMPPETQENLVFSAERAQQFKTVDTHAVQVAKTEHNSFRDLIWDLIYEKNITDDLEKARVIFLWLCTKDLGKMQFRNVQPGSPEEILLNVKQGKATYAQIYETLCSYAGLHCRVIRGYAKGADYKPGMRFHGTQAFHAWNGVLIHGYWRLIDCHWASRRMFGKKGTEHIRYELDDYYFCVDPRQLIYTHFPEDCQWQLLEQPFSLDEFEDMPLVKSLFFRYCLQLETHTHAIIEAHDEFTLTINFQYYRGPGLEFTFSIHTDEGEETLQGMKLSRFGVQDVHDNKQDGKANFWVRPPAPGLYKFSVYAREVQQGESNRMYCAVTEYMLDVRSVPQHIVPFPECSGNAWGISAAAARKFGVSTKATNGIMYTQSGQAEIRFKLHRQLLFSGKLRSNHYSEADLQSCILYRTVGETAIFSISVPAPGEYGLEVFVNDPTKDGKLLKHMCQYLLVCNEHQVSGIRFPQLPAAYLGPQQAYTHLGMSTISNKDPLIHSTTGAMEVSFSTTVPLRATSNLILTAGNKDYTEYILQQFKDNVLSFQIRLPKAGIYKFQIFAQPLNDTSDSLPGVYNYLINCAAAPPPPIPYPKQFSQWKEGCYLYTPVDGNLPAAQPPQDPTPNYIFYQVLVPNAAKVAVVVGGEWTHLERNSDGVWEGAAFFQAGWGEVDTAALTANYGTDSANYNTLLEYQM